MNTTKETNQATLPELAPDIKALLEGKPAVEAARIAKNNGWALPASDFKPAPARKAKRMDISELPAEAQHFRNGLFPAVQPMVGASGKVEWMPTVMNARDTTVRGSILWSGDRNDDRDEAFALACYACDRFVVAEYLDSQGFFSLTV